MNIYNVFLTCQYNYVVIALSHNTTLQKLPNMVLDIIVGPLKLSHYMYAKINSYC